MFVVGERVRVVICTELGIGEIIDVREHSDEPIVVRFDDDDEVVSFFESEVFYI